MTSWSKIARRIRVPLGFALAAVYLWRALPSWPSLMEGSVLIVLGLALRGVASGHLRKNAEVTTSGPYAYLRNPLYLGSLTMAAGFAVAARDVWLAAAMLVFFLAVYLPVIFSEEAWLRANFPEFEEYARRVPRLWPRFSRADVAAGRFSRKLYLEHREYNALLGAVAMLGALVVKLLRFS
ncbi:MAG: isoprenylcysteine carboxylmethyltransferase family protein [Acidobacteriota bacterium]|nr:isoprenylcysteine carboxylmethyltransferase family protein [Acidobacteriota bacterium]